jgi:hypothetical protein
MSQTKVQSGFIEDGSITPQKLSTEAPSWDAAGNLTVSGDLLGSNDDIPVFIWQGIGITRWTVYEDKDYVYDLMPGEMLYIPKEVYHKAEPITPRVGISFGIE